ncbi:MAG: hypothetical protein COB02_07780 [Candidatus Cloacimonadota bacterium]|nr:MAG: hypothetical protein COB02_07780 [Candidatus Cloacimonadota bacterium]
MKNILFLIILLFISSSLNIHVLFAEDTETSEVNNEGTPTEENSDAESDDDSSEEEKKAQAEAEREESVKNCENYFNEGIPGASVCKSLQTSSELKMIKDLYDNCLPKNVDNDEQCRDTRSFGLELNEEITAGVLQGGVFKSDIIFDTSDVTTPIKKMGYHADVFCTSIGITRCLELHSHYLLKNMQGDPAGAAALYTGGQTPEQKNLQRQLDSAAIQPDFFRGTVGRTLDFSKVCSDGDDVKEVLKENFFIETDRTSLHNTIDVGSNLLFACADNPSSCNGGESNVDYSNVYRSNLIKNGCSNKFLESQESNYFMSDQLMSDIQSIKRMGSAEDVKKLLKLLENGDKITDAMKRWIREKRNDLLSETSIGEIENSEMGEREIALCQESAELGALPPKNDGEVSEACKEAYEEQFKESYPEEYDENFNGNSIDIDTFLDKLTEKRNEENESMSEKEKEIVDAFATHESFQEVILLEIRNNPDLIASTALASPDGPIVLGEKISASLEIAEGKFGSSDFREKGSKVDSNPSDFIDDVKPSDIDGDQNIGSFSMGGEDHPLFSNGSFSGGSNSSSGANYSGTVNMNTPLSTPKISDVSFTPEGVDITAVNNKHEELLTSVNDYRAQSAIEKSKSNNLVDGGFSSSNSNFDNSSYSSSSSYSSYDSRGFNSGSNSQGGASNYMGSKLSFDNELIIEGEIRIAKDWNGVDKPDERTCNTSPLTVVPSTNNPNSDDCDDDVIDEIISTLPDMLSL